MLPPQRLSDALSWDPAQVQVIESLPGGPTSDRWHIEHAGEHYMLRVDRALARALGLQREAEVRALQAAHAIRLAPQPVFWAPADGVLLLKWLPGHVCTAQDLQDSTTLHALGRTVARLHREQAAVPQLDVAQALSHYAGQIDTAQAREWAHAGIALLPPTIETPRLCHNDLTAPNIVITAEKIQFLDWEYAAMGDPLFDLAVPAAHYQLSAKACDTLLLAWHAEADLPLTHTEAGARLTAWMGVYPYLLILWLSAVATTYPLNEHQNAELRRAIRRLH